MTIFWYLVALLVGLLGVLLALRGVELMFVMPSGIAFVQLFVGLLFLLGAWRAVGKARASR